LKARDHSFAVLCLICASMLLPEILYGISSMRVKQESFKDFVQGDPKSTSISSDGKIIIAPALEKVYDTKEALIWDQCTGPDGTLYLATGNNGKIFRISKSGKEELLCDLEELEVYAITVNKEGQVFAGASPGGKIYSIRPDGEPLLFYDTNEDYIWDLLFDEEQNLYVATGKNGKLLKITPDKKCTTLYDSPAANILSLARDPNGSLYAATEGKAYILKISPDGKVFMLYESDLDEARHIVCDTAGNLYVALNSGKMGLRDMFLIAPPVSPEEGGAVLAVTEGSPSAAPPSPRVVEAPPTRKGKSSLVKIDQQGYVREIWAPEESPIHCLYFEPQSSQLLAAAGEKGNLYTVKDNGDFTLVRSLEEKYILSMGSRNGGLALATGSGGVLYQLQFDEAEEGIFLSHAVDAKTAVRWGNCFVQAALPTGAQVSLASRSGNSAEPDDTWSEWSKFAQPTNQRVSLASPVARFLQWQVKLQKNKAATGPVLDFVEIYYTMPNLAPQIKQVKVEKARAPEKPEIKVPPEPGKESKAPSGGVPRARPGANEKTVGKSPDSNPKKVTISWDVSDANADDLEATLYFKGDGETTWKKIEDEITNTHYTFDTVSIPDGSYRIKVEVTDLLSNPRPLAQTTSMTSELFIVDNTAPELPSFTAREKSPGIITVNATAKDEASIVAAAQYNVDADDWQYLLPEDGIFDAAEEVFTFDTKSLSAGEHTLSLMVTDDEGNTTVRKVVVTLKGRENAGGKSTSAQN
jgi:hypothetical protein